jgi:hypothetical protein
MQLFKTAGLRSEPAIGQCLVVAVFQVCEICLRSLMTTDILLYKRGM